MRRMLSALALTCALLPAALLGGCAAQPEDTAPPEETLTQEQADAISEKYGLEDPARQTGGSTGADWGVSIKGSPSAEP